MLKMQDAYDSDEEREIPIVLVDNQSVEEQGQQTVFNRSIGAAGIEGQLCEINLSMLFLLKGITDERIGNFHLASNMKNADKFDDIVFKYKDKTGKSKVVFLQAKHKDQKGININSLLSESGDFSLKKYFISYRKIKQQFSEMKGPVFSSRFEGSEFIIYTNAPFSGTDSSVKEGNIDQNDFMRISDSQSKYYQLEFDSDKKERIVNLLKDSSDSRNLAKELAQSISSEKGIDMQKDIFQKYHIALQEKVIEKVENKLEGRLSDGFLNDDDSLSLEDKEFRRVFLDEAGKVFKKQGNELKQELEKKVIKLSNKFGSGSESLKLPNDDPVTEDEIKDFLNKFKLFASQPRVKDLEEIIKDKIKEVYKVEQQDIDNVFSDIQGKVLKWWQGGNYYLTESNRFFQDAARISINFDVKEPVTLFTGRIRELEDLHKILQDGGEAVISQMASVTGLGGIGKSELARKYISEHNKDYDNNVIWINADNYLTIEESFRKLGISTEDENGKEKEIKLIVEDVYSFFAKRHRKSLFIFDNAGKYKASGEEGIDKFLPQSGSDKPHVLITSRNREWGEIKTLPLDVFTEEEAVEFIEKALKGIVELEENEVKKLAEELQYFPLALRQAVAYIKMESDKSNKWKKEKYTIGKYLEQFKEKAGELLSRESSEIHDRYTKTVMTTWQITTDKIKKKVCGRQALEVLNIIAYLAPNDIPIDEIFQKLINDEVRYSAVELLDQYSMANLDGSKLKIHRLVQQATRIELESQGEDKKIVKKTFQLLKVSFPHVNDKLEDYKKKKDLLPHLEVFLSHIDNWLVKKTEDKEMIEESYLEGLLHMMVSGYSRFDNPRRREELLQRALPILEKRYGSNDFRVFNALMGQGGAYMDLGNYQKAKELLEQALEIENKCYLPDYMVASIVENLSITYSHLGDCQKAKEWIEKALDLLRRYYGSDHLEVASALQSKAGIYMNSGDYYNAMELLKQVRAVLEKHYEPGHFEIAKVLANLGEAYGQLGDHEEQKKLTEEALGIFENNHGSNSFQVGLALENLGISYRNLGNHEKAKEVLEKALPILEEFYGANHYHVAKILGVLGATNHSLGDHQKAKELLGKAFSILEKQYDSDRFHVAKLLVDLSSTYRSLGNHQKAKEVLEKVLPILEKCYGCDNILIARIIGNLGISYGALGNAKKAKELLDKALNIQEKYYGEEHVEVAKTRADIGLAYSALCKFHEAKEVLEKALPILEKHSEHLEVAKTLQRLGHVYANLVHYKKASRLLEKALPILEKHYGPEHLKVVEALEALGIVYGALLDFRKVIELHGRALSILEGKYGPGRAQEMKTKLNMSMSIAYAILGHDQKAKESLENASPMFNKPFRPSHFQVEETLDDHQKICESDEKLSKALTLHSIAYSGNLEMLLYILEKGADIFARSSHSTVLHQAVSGGNEEAIRIVLEKIKEKDPQNFSEHINAKDAEGNTPLMWAAEKGKTNAAKILLEYGADPNVKNNDGETALHWATKGSHQEFVCLLLKDQANPNIQDNSRKTPLNLSQEKLAQDSENDNLKMVASLLLNVKDESQFHSLEQTTGSNNEPGTSLSDITSKQVAKTKSQVHE